MKSFPFYAVEQVESNQLNHGMTFGSVMKWIQIPGMQHHEYEYGCSLIESSNGSQWEVNMSRNRHLSRRQATKLVDERFLGNFGAACFGYG
jgi:hypothetical protein